MLILLRHAESELQAEGKLAGRLGCGLSELGENHQAPEAKENLSGYNFDAIFCSDLLRCRLTLKIVMEGNHFATEQDLQNVVFAEELRERSGGSVEGMKYSDMRKILPPKKYKLWQRDYFEAPPDGESMLDVHERVIPYMKEYVFPLANDGKNVLVVTHAHVIRSIIGHIKAADETDVMKWKIENAMPYLFYGKIRSGE